MASCSMFQKSVNRDYKSTQFRYISEKFTLWLETLGYRPKTVKQATWYIDEFFSFLERNEIIILKDFKENHLSHYLEYLQHRPNCIKTGGLSIAYINKQITSIRLLSKYLQQSGIANIKINQGLFKTSETASSLTKEEIKSLYKAATNEGNPFKERDTAMLGIFYGCGLRASEGEALNISDVLFKKSLVYVRKGKNYRERYVPLNEHVTKDIKTYINGQRKQLLQTCPAAGPTTLKAFRKSWKNITL